MAARPPTAAGLMIEHDGQNARVSGKYGKLIRLIQLNNDAVRGHAPEAFLN